jgi:ribosome-binding protein aMBF1 (putative translation factor)
MRTQDQQEIISNAHDRELLTRRELANRLSLSPRTIDNLQRRRVIGYIRISRRCIRFHLPTVMKALRHYQIKAAGQ